MLGVGGFLGGSCCCPPPGAWGDLCGEACCWSPGAANIGAVWLPMLLAVAHSCSFVDASCPARLSRSGGFASCPGRGCAGETLT